MTSTSHVVGLGPVRVAVIIGSTREGRFASTVAKWLLAELAGESGLEVEVIDLADAGLPATLSSRAHPAVAAYRERLDRADAFIVLTPEYNHGYPASLKQAIDLAHREWQAKPVAFVSYGGLSGGIRAVEQLRQVFVEVHATPIRDAVSMHSPWSVFADDGELLEDGPRRALKTMIPRLLWWAEALRDARREHPYAA